MEEKNKDVYLYKYPMVAVACDCVVFGYGKEGLSVLLVKRGEEPCKGKFAFPGGFMGENENAEECAFRELQEESSLRIDYIEQFGVFSTPGRDTREFGSPFEPERVISIAFFALNKETAVVGGSDAAAAEWVLVKDVKAEQMAFDHYQMLNIALEKLRERIHFQPIAFNILPDEFSMPQLQKVYESILDVKFDRRNFSSKILKLGILDVCEAAPAEKGKRIRIMYKLNQDNYNQMKAKGFHLEF